MMERITAFSAPPAQAAVFDMDKQKNLPTSGGIKRPEPSSGSKERQEREPSKKKSKATPAAEAGRVDFVDLTQDGPRTLAPQQFVDLTDDDFEDEAPPRASAAAVARPPPRRPEAPPPASAAAVTAVASPPPAPGCPDSEARAAVVTGGRPRFSSIVSGRPPFSAAGGASRPPLSPTAAEADRPHISSTAAAAAAAASQPRTSAAAAAADRPRHSPTATPSERPPISAAAAASRPPVSSFAIQPVAASILRDQLSPGSFVDVRSLPEGLLAKEPDAFEELWCLHPEQLGKVRVRGMVRETKRWQESYLRAYPFSGITLGGGPLPAALQPYLHWANSLPEYWVKGRPAFNEVLVNWYRDGSHYIGTHSDKTEKLLKDSPILSISLGATRTFRARSRADKTIARDFDMPNGTVLVMGGKMQSEFTHEVPQITGSRASLIGRRINITCRQFAN